MIEFICARTEGDEMALAPERTIAMLLYELEENDFEREKKQKCTVVLLLAAALGGIVTADAAADDEVPFERAVKLKAASKLVHKESLHWRAAFLDANKNPPPAMKRTSGSKQNKYISFEEMKRLLEMHRAASKVAARPVASVAAGPVASRIDSWLIERYRSCWSYFGLSATGDYVPRVRVRMAPDGTLIGQPLLVNPPSDPNRRSLADSAISAVNRCNPIAIPEWFKPHYDAWRDRTVRFDPKEMS